MQSMKIPMSGSEHVSIPVESGRQLSFAFDTSSVSFERVDGDLALTFENGGQITLSGFFEVGERGVLPEIVLPDGAVIGGAEFLQSIDPEFDIATAAGPQMSVSSGGSTYSDAAGDLLGGIDRLGSLEGTGQWTGRDAAEPDLSAVSQSPGIPSGETPGAGGGTSTPNPDPVPEAPYTYVRAALLGADGNDNPIVSVKLLNPDGSDYTGAFPGTGEVSILGPDAGNYNAVYNPQTGTIDITLKDPSLGAKGPENLTVVVDGKSYIVQVTSVAGSDVEDLAGAEWAPVDQGVAFTERTWAGVTNEHRIGGEITTPAGYENTELHVQMTDSSLSAVTGGSVAEKTSSVELDLDNGSFSVSNEGKAAFNVEHIQPVDRFSNMDYRDDFDFSESSYTAAVTTALGAAGKDAESSVTVNGGDVNLQAGGAAPSLSTDGAAYVSATFASDGARVDVEARNVTITASSDGFDGSAPSDAMASVSGIRSHGADITDTISQDWNGAETVERVVGDSTVTTIKAQENVNVDVIITGDADAQDHSSVSYAGVAATERGKVEIEAEGGVAINVVNGTTGGALNTGGTYGIFSGYGFGDRDMMSYEDYTTGYKNTPGDVDGDGYSESGFYRYTEKLGYQYGQELQDGNVSDVRISAAGDVNVNVDLGSQDYNGGASGIKATFGEVHIDSKSDVNVGLSSNGINRGDSGHKLSALELNGGKVYINAVEDNGSRGDVNFSLNANGDNLAVVNFHPYAKDDTNEMSVPTHVSGKNVNITGVAGENSASADNHIAGISAESSKLGFKSNSFTTQADEKFTVDVTAHDNGGTTSSTGIHVDVSASSPLLDVAHRNLEGTLKVGINAEKAEINARVTGDSDAMGDSKAAGISVHDGRLAMQAYDDPSELQYPGSFIWNYTPAAIKDLTVNASGARHNVGLEVTNTQERASSSRETSAQIAAEKLDIIVSGGAVDGDSAGYGIYASAYWDSNAQNGGDTESNRTVETHIHAKEVTIDVSNPQRAVGIHADGQSKVRISSVHEENYSTGTADYAMTVVIKATVTGNDQLRGIAVEAIDGGHVTIESSANGRYVWQPGGSYREDAPALADTVILHGDVVVGRTDAGYVSGLTQVPQSHFTIDTKGGDDRIEINGNVSLGQKGYFTIDAGEGNDNIVINGDMNLNGEAFFTVDAGKGDDLIAVNGNIDFNGNLHGDFNISAGDGNDAILLNGKIAGAGDQFSGSFDISGDAGYDLLVLKAPDVATFNEWYEQWLRLPGTLDNLQCEGFIIQGVESQAQMGWLEDMLTDKGIDVQFFGPDVDLTMINNVSDMAGNFTADGEGSNDLLYVRFDGQEDGLNTLHTAFDAGKIKGMEHVILDMVDGEDQALRADLLNELIGGVRGSDGNASASVILRADADDDLSSLSGAGWNDMGELTTINGQEYHVYANDNDELGNLYVQIISGTNG